MDKVKVAERIKELRTKRHETQAELAKVLDVSAMAISKYENAEMVPSDEVKIKMARHFGESVDSLFFDAR